MHCLRILRSQQARDYLFALLDGIMDPRMYSSLHLSTASAPSLRASEPMAFMAAPPMSDDPGNVKVVVRCRAFLPRGITYSALRR